MKDLLNLFSEVEEAAKDGLPAIERLIRNKYKLHYANKELPDHDVNKYHDDEDNMKDDFINALTQYGEAKIAGASGQQLEKVRESAIDAYMTMVEFSKYF